MSIYFYGKVNAAYFITPFAYKGTDLGDYYSVIAISGLTWTLDKAVRTLQPTLKFYGKSNMATVFRKINGAFSPCSQ